MPYQGTAHNDNACYLILTRRFNFVAGLTFPKQYFYDCNFQMKDVKEQWGLELPECKVLLRRFADADRDQSGRIEMEDFVTLFHLQTYSKSYSERLFGFFDGDGSGAIEFREFLCAVSLVSEGGSTDHRLPLAFAFYDKGGRGFVSMTDLNRTFDDAKRLGVVEEDVVLGDAVFKEFDKVGDGLLNYEEFCAMIMSSEENIKYLEPAVKIVGDYLGTSFEGAKTKVAEGEKVRKKTLEEREAREQRRAKTVEGRLCELEVDGEEVDLLVGGGEGEGGKEGDLEGGGVKVKKEEAVKEMLASGGGGEKEEEEVEKVKVKEKGLLKLDEYLEKQVEKVAAPAPAPVEVKREEEVVKEEEVKEEEVKKEGGDEPTPDNKA